MLDLHNNKARKIIRHPLQIVVIRLLLLDPIIALDAKTGAKDRLERRIRGSVRKSPMVRGKCP